MNNPTPEMIEAGVEEMYRTELQACPISPYREYTRRIYKAMQAVAPGVAGTPRLVGEVIADALTRRSHNINSPVVWSEHNEMVLVISHALQEAGCLRPLPPVYEGE